MDDSYLVKKVNLAQPKKEESPHKEIEYLQLRQDYYSLAFYSFYIDDEEKEDNNLLEQLN